MAGHLVDPTIAEVLVVGLLSAHLFTPDAPAAHTAPALLMAGDAEPPESVLSRFVTLVRVDVEPRERQIGDGHTDVADVVVVLNITCRAAALLATAAAVSQTGQAIAKLLNNAHATHAATGHDLQLKRAVVRKDPPEDRQKRERTGHITVSGVLQRYGGSEAADSVQDDF